jgi:hypothetical protein
MIRYNATQPFKVVASNAFLGESNESLIEINDGPPLLDPQNLGQRATPRRPFSKQFDQ